MVEVSNIPRHVAIIPDGNRRWARARGIDLWKGHEAGAENTERLIREAHNLGIRELSLWGSSLENLTKRPFQERVELFRIYSEYFKKILESKDVVQSKARVRCIGRWREQFPSSLRKLLEDVEEKTRGYDRSSLNFFLAYSGIDDMLQAFRDIARKHPDPVSITETMVKSHLMTAELPPVDFLIRTGGEPHLSAGFLMWDIADSQLFFSEALYPDFGPEAFRMAIMEYSSRSRRFGE